MKGYRIDPESDFGKVIERCQQFLRRFWKFLLYVPVGVAVLAGAISFTFENTYQSKCLLLPPKPGGDLMTLSMVGQMGGIGSLAAGATGLGKDPNDYYLGLLKSQRIADSVIIKLNLASHYKEEFKKDQRKKLAKKTRFVSEKEGLISITVEDKDSVIASKIVNLYVSELQGLMTAIGKTEASRRRMFFEGKIRDTKMKMMEVEDSLKFFLKRNKMLSVEASGMVIVQEMAALRTEIAKREVVLGTMASSMTAESPQYRQVLSELNALRSRVNSMQSESPDGTPGNTTMPDVGVAYMRLFREKKYQETLFEILAKQYEIARIDEAKEGALIQVIDPGEVPEKKIRPVRSSLVVEVWFFSTILCFGVALARLRRII